MGRHKHYNRENVLEQARLLFNERGFSATSIADLEERLGINRKSIYAEFGDKQALFEAALDRHHDVSVSARFAPLETKDAGLREIQVVLETWARGARGPRAGIGCLLCNTASERAAADLGSRKHVRNYFRRVQRAFKNALENAQARGEIASSFDVDAEAHFFTSHGIGQLTIIRSKAAPAVVEAAGKVAVRHLQSLRPGRRG